MLANDEGKWFGNGIGDIFDIKIPFKNKIHFSEYGVYRFEIEQGMRIENLPFILEVGFRVQKSDVNSN
jgi:gliding motility-associated lipoprotein GldH